MSHQIPTSTSQNKHFYNLLARQSRNKEKGGKSKPIERLMLAGIGRKSFLGHVKF